MTFAMSRRTSPAVPLEHREAVEHFLLHGLPCLRVRLRLDYRGFSPLLDRDVHLCFSLLVPRTNRTHLSVMFCSSGV
jgi:hypothetical protein